ncbi:MutT/Nudix family protein [Bacillus sp. JCM 19046]|nr:MutT/Nudix family protein [Bacillus sp. JCM 19045]GAF18138.1 MutT/Nudix family protein [Bacillus sp. JCM 19046]
MEQKWIHWARKMHAIAQSGIAFSRDVYDLERYEELRSLSAEIMEQYSEVKKETIEEWFAKEEGYQTPKLDVRGALFKENKILLVREKAEHRWSLPGGFCDVGLSAKENIVKEIKEESGYDAEVLRLVALLDMNKHNHPVQPFHYYKLFFHCRLLGGEGEVGLETDQVGFFSRDCLPEVSTGRNTTEQIQLLFSFYDNPQKQTVVD